MFTGIIEGLGAIVSIRPSNQGKRFFIESDFDLEGTRVGDSIAVSGTCLTAITINRRQFSVDVSPETLKLSILGTARNGDSVNLERALKLSDRLDGHLVSGHVDGTGRMKQKTRTGNAIIISYSVPPSLSRYMIKKGSVAVDGVSLTINNCDREHFEVSIIPHTANLTTIGMKKIGDPVNIETDMIGKYVERFVLNTTDADGEKKTKSSIDRTFLLKNGFI